MTSDHIFIAENARADVGSMVFRLHREGILDRREFSRYCVCAKSVISDVWSGERVDPKLVAMTYSICAEILKKLSCHFNPDDIFHLLDMDDDLLSYIYDELSSAFPRYLIVGFFAAQVNSGID